MEALSPTGGPGRKLPPEAAADHAAAEERSVEWHLWPGESHVPPGPGGEFREGQRPATQQPSAEEKQTTGEPHWLSGQHWGPAEDGATLGGEGQEGVAGSLAF